MREKRPGGRVFLQHAIFVLGASMVWILLASMIQLIIYNLSRYPGPVLKNTQCQPLVSQSSNPMNYIDISPWRKPLEMLGPRSSSGDGCARHHAGDVLTVSLFFHWFNGGFGFQGSSYERDYLGAPRDFQTTAPQHQWTIGWFLVELFQSPAQKPR